MKMIAIEAINTPATAKLLLRSQLNPCRRKFITNDSLINAFIPYYASNNPELVTPIKPVVCDASAVPANTVALMGPMTQQQTAGGSCPVPAPTADSLTAGHIAAAGDRAQPGYGGQCKPDDYKRREDKKISSCTGASGCLQSESTEIKLGKIEKIQQCIDARRDMMDSCFMGGDKAHQREAQNERDKLNLCKGRF